MDQTAQWNEEEVFVANLRRARVAADVSQSELARRVTKLGIAGFHQQTVQRIEAGSRPVRLNEATAIASALNLDFGQMLTSATSEAVARDLMSFVSSLRHLWGTSMSRAGALAGEAGEHARAIRELRDRYEKLAVGEGTELNSDFLKQVDRILTLLSKVQLNAGRVMRDLSYLHQPKSAFVWDAPGRGAVTTEGVDPIVGEIVVKKSALESDAELGVNYVTSMQATHPEKAREMLRNARDAANEAAQGVSPIDATINLQFPRSDDEERDDG